MEPGRLLGLCRVLWPRRTKKHSAARRFSESATPTRRHLQSLQRRRARLSSTSFKTATDSITTIALEATFQVLPIYLRLSHHVPALQAFGGPAILLVWLYVMANVIVFGAEVNWWLAHRRRPSVPEEAAGLA